MNIIYRAGRAYLAYNLAAWQQVRRAAVPILIVVGVASFAIGTIGAMSGDQVLVWAPAVYVWTLAISFSLARWLP